MEREGEGVGGAVGVKGWKRGEKERRLEIEGTVRKKVYYGFIEVGMKDQFTKLPLSWNMRGAHLCVQ